MIEAILYFALGALSAGIVALMIGAPVWRRAVRLTRREIEQSLPMSPAEIRADKDALRAQFAVSTRRLESTIERLQLKMDAQMRDIEQRREAIAHLTAEGSLSVDGRVALETQRNDLLVAVAKGDVALATTKARLLEVETELATLRDSVAADKASAIVGEIARAGRETKARTADLEGRDDELTAMKLELAAARAQIEGFTIRLVDGETTTMSLLAIRESKAEMEARLVELEARNAMLEEKLAAGRDGPAPLGGADMEPLRSKLLEIGASVARLAAAKGDTPDIAPPISVAIAPPSLSKDPSAEAAMITLAERIRALQRASGNA